MEPYCPFGITCLVPQDQRSFFGVLSHIINPLLTKLVRSRWLDIGFVFFACLWTSPSCRSITRQKRTWPISSHLDRTSLVNNPHISKVGHQFSKTYCIIKIMVGHLLQNSTIHICMQQSILIQLQHRIFSFNGYIHSTSTRALFIQQLIFLYSFNFNTGYFCASRIFIQLLRLKLCFMERIYLFKFKKNIFIQQKIFIQLFASSRTSITSYSTKLHLPTPLLPLLKKRRA